MNGFELYCFTQRQNISTSSQRIQSYSQVFVLSWFGLSHNIYLAQRYGIHFILMVQFHVTCEQVHFSCVLGLCLWVYYSFTSTRLVHYIYRHENSSLADKWLSCCIIVSMVCYYYVRIQDKEVSCVDSFQQTYIYVHLAGCVF